MILKPIFNSLHKFSTPMGNLDFKISEVEISRRLLIAQQLSDDVMYPEHLLLANILSEPSRPAAVLMPLLKRDGVWQLLFTRRNSNLPEHSGQVAFPGGRSDPEDPTPEATALREAQEEINLHPQNVNILGRLNDHLTVTNYRVTPVVAAIPWPYEFKLEEAEVSRVFTIPLNWLADPSHHEERKRKLPHPFAPIPVIYFQPYEGEVLWGVSARLTLRLMDILSTNGVK